MSMLPSSAESRRSAIRVFNSATGFSNSRNVVIGAWRYWRGGLPSTRGCFEATRSTSAFVRSEEHTSELTSLMRTSDAVFVLKKKTDTTVKCINHQHYTLK